MSCNCFGNQKLTVGGTAEKIVSGYHLVFSEHSSENLEMSKCKSAIQHISKMEEDVDLACRKGRLTIICSPQLPCLSRSGCTILLLALIVLFS